ncbi:MAG: NfeD family protein [Phycisphaerales bacterium JB064]
MKPVASPNTFGLWRSIRLVATAMAMLCLVAVEVGLASQDQPAAQPPTAVPATRQADKVVVLPIRTAIDRFTMKGLEQRLDRAQQDGTQAVVIELDTPGGEVGAVLEISDLLKTSQVPTIVAWVNNTAFSGGAIIAMACDDIVTNDPGTLGDAIPIQVSAILGLQQLSEEERQKILAPLLIDLVDSARRNGYDEKLVQGFVSLGVELWMIERTRPGPEGQPVGERLFIDLAEYRLLFGEPSAARSPQIPSAGTGQKTERSESAPSAEQGSGTQDPTAYRPAAPQLESLDADQNLSRGLAVPTQRPTLSEGDRGGWQVVAYVTDGKAPVTMTSEQLVRYGVATTVVRNDEELKAFFGASTLVRWEESAWMAVARFMSNPVIRGVLIVAVLVGFFIEMASPGLGIPGAIGLLALIGLLTPAAMVGMAGWWEFAALGLGVLLVLVEIFLVPGLGVPGVIGAVLLFLGLLGTFTGGGGFQTQQELLTGVVVLLLSLASAGVVIFLIAKNLGRIPGLNRLILKSVPADDDEDSPSFFEAMSPSVPKAQLAVGATGAAVGTLRPSGRARFGEELVDVVSVGPMISDGQAVRVVQVSGFSVVVEPADSAEPIEPTKRSADAQKPASEDDGDSEDLG